MKGLGKGRGLERGKGSHGEEAGRCMVRMATLERVSTELSGRKVPK